MNPINCGIARFRAKPNENEISDLVISGNVRHVEFLDTGRYRVTLDESLPDSNYQVVFSLQPGFLPGVIFQNESSIDVGLKGRDGEWVDQGEILTVSFNYLTI